MKVGGLNVRPVSILSVSHQGLLKKLPALVFILGYSYVRCHVPHVFCACRFNVVKHRAIVYVPILALFYSKNVFLNLWCPLNKGIPCVAHKGLVGVKIKALTESRFIINDCGPWIGAGVYVVITVHLKKLICSSFF